MAVYCFDLDGVICTHTCDKSYSDITPNEDVIHKINYLYDAGHTIKIFTARGMGRYKDNAHKARNHFHSMTLAQLENWNIKFHTFQMGKLSADYYIDDKAIKFLGDTNDIPN